MALFKNIIIITFTVLAVLLSGCTNGQDVTPVVKVIPEVQQFLKEHPNAKITVTYWSKEDVANLEQEITKQCEKPITPVAMYKATISEGDVKSIAWIDAGTKTVICTTIEGKSGTPVNTYIPVQTTSPAATGTSSVTSTPLITPTPVITPTPSVTTGLESSELKIGYMIRLARVDGVAETRNADGTMMYSKSGNDVKILIQLLRNGNVVNEQVVAEGMGFNLNDEGKLIVRANFRTLFLGATGYMARIDDLVQYDKETGGTLFTQHILNLAISYPSTPTATPTSTLIPTPTSTLVPTLTSTPSPTPTPESTSVSTYTVTEKILIGSGDTWQIGNEAGSDLSRGYSILVQTLFTNATPIDPEWAQKKVRIWFAKNGVHLDAQNVAVGETYTYNDIFSTKVASIYTSGGVEYIRLENTNIAK